MLAKIMLAVCAVCVVLIIYKAVNSVMLSIRKKNGKKKAIGTLKRNDKDYYKEIVEETRKNL